MKALSIGAVLFLSVFAIIGLGAMSFGIWGVMRGAESNAWPTAPGEIIRSDYDIVENSADRFRTDAIIEYTYKAVGKTFTSDQLDAGGLDGGSPSDDRRRTNEYPVGKKVNVPYNPDEPSDAMLIPGVASGSWILIAFGAIFTAVPIVIGLVAKSAISRIDNGRHTTNLDSQSVELPSPRLRGGGSHRPLMGFLVLMGFFGIFLTVGAVLLGIGLSTRSKELAAKSWPSTQGVVVYRGVREEKHENDNGTDYSYHPRVVFDFDLEGTTYTSEGLSFVSRGYSTHRAALEELKPYRNGEPVEVFYNPEDRYDAILQPGASSGSLIFLILGSVFSAVGGIAMVGIGIHRVKSGLKLGEGETVTPEGESYDPFDETEVTDPFDVPWSSREADDV